MAPPASRRDRHRLPVRTAVKGVSWMSLLAATSLGVAAATPVRATVRAGDPHALVAGSGELRLIVQAYARDALNDDLLPRSDARPRASAQRSVTAEELQAGVDVSMVELGELGQEHSEGSVVVAWLESGTADLEYDALSARPQKGAYLGAVATDAPDGVAIVLRRA
jgi:hypothetical protein